MLRLWGSLEDAKRGIAYGLEQADVVKISDNEVVFMTGEEDYDKAAWILREEYQIPLLLVTLGKDGSRAYYKDICTEAAPYILENTIETTGAALITTRRGALKVMPGKDEILKLIAK